MPMNSNQYSQKVGLPPGSLVYVGKEKTEPVTITEFSFSKDHFDHKKIDSADISKDWEKEKVVSWIDVNGIHDTSVIEEIGAQLNLDALVLEDIVNTNHRPKMEELDDYLLVVLKTIKIDNNESFHQEQVSILLGQKGVVTFQESGSENFALIKDRIINNKGTIRQRKPDFMFYRAIDTLVDNYFLAVEFFEDQVEKIENKLASDPNENVQQEIYELKSKLSLTKKAMVPLLESISGIMKSDNGLIEDSSEKYFRDVYDHVVQIIDTLDSQRESVTDFLNLYMSALSNKMNEVMKVLTIYATIFIPLTFIAGIFG